MIGPTRRCRSVLLLYSSYLEIDPHALARVGMGLRLGIDLTVRDFKFISGQPELDSVSDFALLVQLPSVWQFLSQTGISSRVPGHTRANKQMEYINYISFLRPFAAIS